MFVCWTFVFAPGDGADEEYVKFSEALKQKALANYDDDYQIDYQERWDGLRTAFKEKAKTKLFDEHGELRREIVEMRGKHSDQNMANEILGRVHNLGE